MNVNDIRKELLYYIPAAQRQTDYVKALLLGQNPEYDDTEERRKLGLTTRDDNGWTDVKKAASWVADKAKQFGKKVYEGATDIDPLLQLGLVNHVFGNDSVLSMYNANKQAEQAREAQREYNEYLREYDRAKAEREEAKQKSINRATAQAKINSLLDGYGYMTPQQRSVIDSQIYMYAKEGDLDMSDIDALKNLAVVQADDEIKERSAKNQKLDPLKQEIRLHGLYSSEPTDWKRIDKETAKAIQQKLGFTGTDVDGVLGKKSIAAIENWNKTHNADEQIKPPNELADILNKIDNLKYEFNGVQKDFSPAELDELRKLVYGGEDPAAQRRTDWDNFYHDQAKDQAKKRLEQNELQKQADEAITNNVFEPASTPLGKQIRKTHNWVKGTGWKKN